MKKILLSAVFLLGTQAILGMDNNIARIDIHNWILEKSVKFHSPSKDKPKPNIQNFQTPTRNFFAKINALDQDPQYFSFKTDDDVEALVQEAQQGEKTIAWYYYDSLEGGLVETKIEKNKITIELTMVLPINVICNDDSDDSSDEESATVEEN